MEGLSATELSDEELERQGTHAHATRNWVFLHGTAEQFRHHTERMLELEQEYLRRHPKRTWQGSGGGGGPAAEATQLDDLDRLSQLRALLHQFTREMEALLGPRRGEPATPPPGRLEAALLERFERAPGGGMHRLEAHQAARELGADPRAVARLYTGDPALLATERELRRITPAGRAWLEQHRSLLGDGRG
jgi:hypothetical protein